MCIIEENDSIKIKQKRMNFIRGCDIRCKKHVTRLTCFVSLASNQGRIPGSLYTVVKVVRSIHMD